MKTLLIFIFILFPSVLFAAPLLNFSDINSGPATGNGDGLGSGVIVTIWGNNLGSTQGTSKVYVGGVEATQVYYWRNADGTHAGSPADLYTYHKMQEICFAIPATATSGANTIKVTVDGIDSNSLDFTVRSGNIYFVKSTGNDTTGDGSWANPWVTLQHTLTGGTVSPGDTIYSVGVDTTSGLNVGNSAKLAGTEAAPISLIAYPDTQVDISGVGYPGHVIYNYYYTDDSRASTYINFSKLSITGYENGVDDALNSQVGIVGFMGMRVVGVEITGPTVYSGTKGAIGGNHQAAGGGKMYGVYIHNYGRDNGVAHSTAPGTGPSYTSESEKTSWDAYQHLYYLSNRNSPTNLPYEIAWNYLVDNPIWQGIHIYDQSGSGGWSGTLKIHHNVVKNQRGGAIEIDLPNMTNNPDIEIYNNLIISDADDVYNFRAFQLLAPHSNVKVWNNTVYGWMNSNRIDNLTDDFRNNLMYDNKGVDFWADEPTTHTNNLFYSSQGTDQPTWAGSEVGNVTGDPLFTNISTEDFSLQISSPAKDTGATTSPIVIKDFVGLSRPQGSAYDIGAFEYDEDSSPTCDSSHLNLCSDQPSCEGAGGNWCTDTCQSTACSGATSRAINCSLSGAIQ